MRKYSKVDLLRFRTFAAENPEMKPIELLKAYDEKFPELTAFQQVENIKKFLQTKAERKGK